MLAHSYEVQISRGLHTCPNSLIGEIRIHTHICGALCAKHAMDFIGAGLTVFVWQ